MPYLLILTVMKVSEEIIIQITEMASAYMKPQEIALLLDLDTGDFEYQVISKPESQISKAYFKGRAQTKLDLRIKIFDLAKKGSPQAEVLADKYLSQE